MNKVPAVLVALVLIAVLLVGAIHYLGRPGGGGVMPQPEFDELTFEMKYRGLTSEPDSLRYNSFWGFGSSNSDDQPFIQAVKAKAGEIETVYNPNFKGAEWAAVARKDNKATQMYFDLNADGELADNEIIPATKSPNGQEGTFEFITPDFTMKTDDGETQFRALLQARVYTGSDQLNCTWSPACVLEGTADVDGVPAKLILYANGFSGGFDTFGSNTFSLLFGERREGQYVPRTTLSKITDHAGTFYRMQIEQGENGEVARVTLKKDTSPTGELKVTMVGDNNVKARLNNATVKGAEDKGIQFNVGQGASRMPQGQYEVASGYVIYGLGDKYNWNVSFTNGPTLAIEPNKVSDIALGEPKMEVVAVDEKKRYASPPEEETTYSKGTTVFLSPRVLGKAGEIYGRFNKTENNRSTAVEPTVTITDSEGKQVASETMEYG